jgi:diguanylate cyclase (GGDEF)-like protein
MDSEPTESRTSAWASRATPFAWIREIVRGVDRLPAPALHLVIGALLAAVAAIDVGCGLGERGELLYLLPVSIASYHAFVGFGIGVAMASAIVCAWTTALATPAAPAGWGWTATNRFGLFLFVAALLTALRRAYDEEKALARSDALTGAANLRHFREAAMAELARARRYGRPVTIAMLDIDDFKRINDLLGHDGGDAVLREVAATLGGLTRKVDVVARVGGDEFAVLLPETDPKGAQRAAERFRTALARAMAARGGSVSFSVGVVTTLDPTLDLDELLRRADELAYAVKRSGKDAVRCAVVEPDVSPERLRPARSRA